MCAPNGARIRHAQTTVKVKESAVKVKIATVKVKVATVEVNFTTVKVKVADAPIRIRARVKQEKQLKSMRQVRARMRARGRKS